MNGDVVRSVCILSKEEYKMNVDGRISVEHKDVNQYAIGYETSIISNQFGDSNQWNNSWKYLEKELGTSANIYTYYSKNNSHNQG